MKGKTIIQLIDTLDMGGAERMTVNIANMFAEQGINSHIIISRYTGALESSIISGVKVTHLEKKSFKDFRAFKKLYNYTKSTHPDIVHCHGTSVFWGVALKMIYPKFQLIWHDHFGLSDQLDQYPRKSYKMMTGSIDGIIAVNKKLEVFWKSYLKNQDEKVTFLPNFPFLKNTDKAKEKVFSFVCLANFRPQKNQLNLVDAVEILVKNQKKFQVLLAGQLIDKSWYAQLVHEIEKRNLKDYIQILGPVEEVSELLNQVHVGVLSSDSEGLPVALLEYALAGLPIITTDVGDCKKVLKNGHLGKVVRPNNAHDLSNAMNEVIENYNEALELAKETKSYIQENYGAIKFYREYQSFISRLAN